MSENQLLVSRSDHTGLIRLNRPEALNSLNLDMLHPFVRAVDDFGNDPDILAVVVAGEGGRGLCAGGDLRALYDSRHLDRNPFKAFWREEFELNARIAVFPKPYIALMDGIVMGAGVGLSAHGNCRIVTERTRLAMPETRIGFVPDVGATWLLTRNGGAGFYMALSGEAIGAEDAIQLGLADILIDAVRIPELTAALMNIRHAEEIQPLLAGFAREPGTGLLARNRDLLDRAMMENSVEAILAALIADGSGFASQAAKDIAGRSPTSLKLTHGLLKRGMAASRLEECLTAEYRAVCGILGIHDLFEGIRAAIIDKDHCPRWSPATLEQVDMPLVADLMKGTGEPEPVYVPW